MREKSKRILSPGSDDEYCDAMSPSPHTLRNSTNPSAGANVTDTTDVGDSTLHNSKRMRSTVRTLNSTERYTETATCIAKQIKEDKDECRFVIATYTLDPHELLHLLEHWTQHLIKSFKQRREHFKLILKDMWDRGELNGLKCEDTEQRSVYLHIEKLTQWKQTSSLITKPYSDDLQMVSDNIKQTINKYIDELLDVMESVVVINETVIRGSSNELTKTTCLSAHITGTIKQLQGLRKVNEKEYNTICIIGLEKAGKSSFINALVGFELLPHKIERCTQIQTVLKPVSKDDENRFATIEFYADDEFAKLVDKIPKEKDETDEAFRKRVASIKKTRKQTMMPNTALKHMNGSNQSERDKIIPELHKFIVDPLYLNIVKQVVIYTNKLPGQNYILLDVPGCDSPIEEHRLSAINAVQKSDAFLFLTDGQRPSLTNEQIHLLQEIQTDHFDAMKRAFGIITKLDLCPTHTKFVEHKKKTIGELRQNGFLQEKIHCICAHISLPEGKNTNVNDLRKVKDHIAQFDTLSQGFDECKQVIKQYIEHDLPNTRLRQVLSIARQKIVRCVDEALTLGRQIIPIDTEQSDVSFDDYIKRVNSESWNDIFTNERYEPVLRRAAHWQKYKLVIERQECTNGLKNYFKQRFQECTQEIVDKEHPIEEIMIGRHDIALLQMNPYGIETDEREKITSDMLKAVAHASDELAAYMYDTYINELETILNGICPEQENLFQTTLTQKHCSIELQTLVRRTAHPIIMATLRWPYIYEQNRIEAGEELLRVSPMIAFNIHEGDYKNGLAISNNGLLILKETFRKIFEAYTSNDSPMALVANLLRPYYTLNGNDSS
ncbi:unnamed protein product [Adineta steineri]|uniref:Dynamin N-terminal domain-containing protein n=1 Tax=Adineta steineri TaxID=433720 RepID=A0A814WW62_9BILA|nr:unnamed protein product [Adineta steineri]